MDTASPRARIPWSARLALLAVCLGAFSADPEPGRGQPSGSPGQNPATDLHQLYEQARAGYAPFHSYICRYVEREPSNGKISEQILIFYFRKEPWSVHFKWLLGEGQGREVLYVKGQYENKLHVVLAPGDVPLLPGGYKMDLSLDSALVKEASKKPITESGIGALLDRFGRALEANEKGDFSKGRLTLQGEKTRPDYDVPLVMVEEKLPPNADPDVPHGGRRLIGFHSRVHLPVLNELHDDVGQLVSYYRFDRLELGVRLGDEDFNPAKIGPPPASKRK